MRKRVWLVLFLVLLIVLSTACEGGTSGSVVGSRESCSSRGGSGTCKGSWRKLSGTYGQDIEDEWISGGEAITVKAQVSVESGTVRVSVESPDDQVSSVDVAPGKPATLVGIAEGAFEEFEVRFEAVEGEATGISYEIAYQLP